MLASCTFRAVSVGTQASFTANGPANVTLRPVAWATAAANCGL